MLWEIHLRSDQVNEMDRRPVLAVTWILNPPEGVTYVCLKVAYRVEMGLM